MSNLLVAMRMKGTLLSFFVIIFTANQGEAAKGGAKSIMRGICNMYRIIMKRK